MEDNEDGEGDAGCLGVSKLHAPFKTEIIAGQKYTGEFKLR